MGLFFDAGNMKQKMEEQTARDHTNMRNWSDRRKARYDRIMNEPILPRFCTICFICMVIGTAIMAIFDVYASITYLSHLGFLHLMSNVSTSAFFCWLIFAIPLIPCALVQLRRGFSDPYFERFAMKKNGKPRMPLEKRFRIYVKTSIIGTAVLFLFYIIVRIFL